MKQEQNRRRREPPRVYDRRSGEYRPMPLSGARREADISAEARRRAELRGRRRRRAKVVFYLFLFLSVSVAAVAVSLLVLFKINAIDVTGTSRYSRQEIVNASGIHMGENLFLAQTGEAGGRIVRTLPYIGSVSVERSFPSKIVIRVGEAKAVGAMEYQNRYAVTGPDGRVLELADKPPDGCPAVKGIGLSSAKAGQPLVYKDASQKSTFEELTKVIADEKLGKVTSMDFSVSYRVTILYDGRVTMNLGVPSDLDYKIRFAKSILDSGGIGAQEKGTLDLSIAPDVDEAFFDPDYSQTPSSSASSSKTKK